MDQRHRLAVDGADRQGERVEALDAAEIHAVAVLIVLAVADIGEDAASLAEIVPQDLLVPQITERSRGS
jgi:hypothetical protein